MRRFCSVSAVMGNEEKCLLSRVCSSEKFSPEDTRRKDVLRNVGGPIAHEPPREPLRRRFTRLLGLEPRAPAFRPFSSHSNELVPLDLQRRVAIMGCRLQVNNMLGYVCCRDRYT